MPTTGGPLHLYDLQCRPDPGVGVRVGLGSRVGIGGGVGVGVGVRVRVRVREVNSSARVGWIPTVSSRLWCVMPSCEGVGLG